MPRAGFLCVGLCVCNPNCWSCVSLQKITWIFSDQRTYWWGDIWAPVFALKLFSVFYKQWSWMKWINGLLYIAWHWQLPPFQGECLTNQKVMFSFSSFLVLSFSLSQIILDSFLYRINKMQNRHSLLLQKNYHIDYCICQGGERWEFVFPVTETVTDPRSLLFWGNELAIEVFYEKEWVDTTPSLTVLERRLSCFVSVKQLVPELIKSDFLWFYFFCGWLTLKSMKTQSLIETFPLIGTCTLE